LSLIIVVFALPAITLWLVESSLKYAFYFFEVALILIIYSSIFGNFKKLKSKIKERTSSRRFDSYCIDYSLVVCAISLLLLDAIGLIDNYACVFLGVIVALYLPGWSLIRTTSIFKDLKGIEMLVIPFVLSIPLSSLMFSIFLVVQNIDKFLLVLAYLVISILPIIKSRLKHEEGYPIDTGLLKFSVPTLIWLVAFFSFAILVTYPQMALVPGLDIVRHLSFAKQLVLAPASYQGSELWFNIHQASVYLISTSSIQVFQTIMAFLSIFSIFSFYMMSKAYLADIDKRLPIIATLFWGVFSGLGWLDFLSARIANPDSSAYYSLLYTTNNRSYWDVGYGQGWIWLWYRPITLGLTLLFTLLYLLREHRLGKKAFLLTFTLLLLTLNFVHFPESMVFVLFLLILSIIKPIKELRMNEAATSSILAMLISLPLLLIYQNFVGMSITSPAPALLVLLTVAGALSALLNHYEKRPKIARAKFWPASKWLITGLSIIYIWLLATWLITAKNFSTADVAIVLGVPWLFYPMLLGLGGLFAIFSSKIIFKRHVNHPIIAFALLLLFAVFFGRLLTYINVNVGHTGYWERRIVPIAYAGASVLAPVSLMELFERAKRKKTALLAVLLAFVVVFGFTSTCLTLELQVHEIQNFALSGEDLKVVDMLNELDAKKVLLTATDSTLSLAEFAPNSWLINYYRYQLWPAQYPEMPLNVIYSLDKPVYILLQEADLQEINQNYASGYLATHLLPLLMSNSSNDNAQIISMPEMVAPCSNSQTLLVLPNSPDPTIWYAYDILSQAGYNYSTVVIDDVAAISKAKVLIASTDGIAQTLIQYKNLFDLGFDKLIILNLDGYGNLASNYFSNPKMTLSLDEASKESANLESGLVTTDNLTTIAGPLEFEIHSNYDSGGFLPLLNDSLDGWVPSGMGSGQIGLPELSLNYETNISGNASVEMDVKSGEFAYWQIGRSWPEPLNVSNFDFISFYWYGKGDGKNYVLQFSSSSSNRYWYYFKDSWQGWKKVVIPMRIPDGSYDLNGVYFVKVTDGGPTWNNIVNVAIRNEGSNPNLAGTFLIGHFGFEAARTINVNLETQSSVGSFGLLNYDGASWVNVAQLTSNETVSVSNYTLSSGMNSEIMFGERALLNASVAKGSDSSILRISVRLPPVFGDIDLSSIKIEIVPEIPEIKANEILGPNGSLALLAEPNAITPTDYKDVISWYKGEEGTVPFSIKGTVSGVDTIYINVYPLVTDGSYAQSNYEILGKILDASGTGYLFTKTQIKAENPVQGELATFNKVDFEGNITIYSDTSVIVRGEDSAFTLEFNGMTMSDVSEIVFAEDKATLKTSNGSVSGGEGFYSNIYANEFVANSNVTLGPTLLEFYNGTMKMINIPAQQVQIIGNSTAVLRQPTIQVEGNAKFDNLYTYALLSTLGILGDSASLQGKLSFKVVYGDTFTVTNNFAYQGQITGAPEYNYNELGPLVQSLPILIIICLTYLTFYYLKKRIRIRKEAEI